MNTEQKEILFKALLQNVADVRCKILNNQSYEDLQDEGELIIQNLAKEYDIFIPSLQNMRQTCGV